MAGRDTDSPALPHFIDGERVAGESNRFGDVYDPATRRPGGSGRGRRSPPRWRTAWTASTCASPGGGLRRDHSVQHGSLNLR